jgi:molybdate transport system substrate-binding protein
VRGRLAAASLSDALTEVATRYERQTGDRVRLDFGASSTLALQIEKGAPADLFFSADEAKMDELERRGLLLAGTRRSLLGNTLAVVVPADDPRPLGAVDELAGPRCRTLALAEPQTVPAGIYARTYLERLGLWPRLRDRVLPTANVRAALAAVAAGNADAAIVYRTDAAVSKQVRVALTVPAGEGPSIVYPIAVLAESREPTAARRLLAAIASPEGLAIFARHGFLTAPAP